MVKRTIADTAWRKGGRRYAVGSGAGWVEPAGPTEPNAGGPRGFDPPYNDGPSRSAPATSTAKLRHSSNGWLMGDGCGPRVMVGPPPSAIRFPPLTRRPELARSFGRGAGRIAPPGPAVVPGIGWVWGAGRPMIGAADSAAGASWVRPARLRTGDRVVQVAAVSSARGIRTPAREFLRTGRAPFDKVCIRPVIGRRRAPVRPARWLGSVRRRRRRGRRAPGPFAPVPKEGNEL